MVEILCTKYNKLENSKNQLQCKMFYLFDICLYLFQLLKFRIYILYNL